MLTVIIGILAFPLFLLYDYFNLKKWRGGLVFFLLGSLLLTVTTAVTVIKAAGGAFTAHPVLSSVGAVLTLASLLLLVYVLFFALPVFDVYLKKGGAKTITTGVYSVCRHPGVWFLALTYLCLFITLRTLPAFTAFVAYTLLDAAYVYIQDRFIFPKTLSGYDDYKTSTPFLIPAPHISHK